MPKNANHAMDHMVHPATFNTESGNYDHPSSLSDHLNDDIAAVKSRAEDVGRKAINVVKNLTGEGEREDLFNK